MLWKYAELDHRFLSPPNSLRFREERIPTRRKLWYGSNMLFPSISFFIGRYHQGALHTASQRGYLPIVKLLLSRRCNPDAADSSVWILHFSAAELA
jgi:hypothetical protein